MNAIRCFVLSLSLFLVSTPLWADTIVASTLNLTQLQITPSAGSLQISTGVSAATFAQALDSLGGFDQDGNTVFDAATSANAATGLASASGAASAPALSGTAFSGVNIPNIDAFASSEGQALLSGTFQINGAAGPVSVQFNALLSASQSLLTNGNGQSASSELTFQFLLPDVSASPLLFYDNLLTIGPNQSLSQAGNPNQTAALILQANTPYSFFISLDSESNGVSVVPEPSSFLLFLAGMGLVFTLGRCVVSFTRTGAAAPVR